MNVPRTRRSRFSDDPVPPNPPAGGAHRPVLLHEVVEQLDIQPGDTVLDATLGGAGHARALAEKLGARGTFIGFDLDADAIARAESILRGVKPKLHLIEANFRDIRRELQARGIHTITKALFDLGWSSYQLDSGRGFSLQADEPLGMTYSKQGGVVTAATVVNTWQEQTLADIIYGFGQERYARRIAKAIVERREKKPFSTSRELAEFISASVPAGYRHGKLHPATRTFQALRIAVNDELGALAQGIRGAFEMLAPNGRVAVITFHSVEDRAVKQLFAALEKEGRGKRATKKPLTPSPEEIAGNRRARSAKLRVFQKNHDKEITQNKQVQDLRIAGEV
jgi:16S rRNA (cytosine1402-N4)-methyltransferase